MGLRLQAGEEEVVSVSSSFIYTRAKVSAGRVHNVVTKNITLDRVSVPLHVYQTNGGSS